jgi:mono/diheme cytochrome c family protein
VLVPLDNQFLNMKNTLIIFCLLALFIACAGEKKNDDNTNSTRENGEATAATKKPEEYDPKRGEGKWSAENVALGATLDPAMADEGEKIAKVKCASCHKTTTERLVGPGWSGVTKRRAPEWIMNFITNPDPMISKDPAVQAQLELCLVRMPNQNLADNEARAVLEYMRRNDGVK